MRVRARTHPFMYVLERGERDEEIRVRWVRVRLELRRAGLPSTKQASRQAGRQARELH